MTTTKTLKTVYGNIHVEITGSGDPLLLVHGLLVSGKSFSMMTQALGELRQVICVDLPGHGESSAGDSFVPSWDGYCNVLRQVMDEIGVEQVDLCGHSMGGGVCAVFAGLMPSRVKKLILIDSLTALFRMPLKARFVQLPLIGEIIFHRLYGERMFLSYCRNDVFFDATKLNRERVHHYYCGFDKNRAVTLRAIRLTANPKEVVSQLSAIEADTLVLWGQNDSLIPLFVAHETVRHIKRADLKTIEQCGHSPMEECPDETIEYISSFLNS